MQNYSKQLSKNDISGEHLSTFLFHQSILNNISINFDRIHYDYLKDAWIIAEHILIDKEYETFQDLPINIQNQIIHLQNFLYFFQNQSQQKTHLLIDLYFSKESNKDYIIGISKDLSFKKISFEEYSLWLRKTNFYGTIQNKFKEFSYNIIDSKTINSQREDNTAFSLSKSLLNSDVTNGVNFDKILFDDKKQKCFILEYLLCEEIQKVSPYSSHPNKYFYKNSQKFVTLFNISRILNSELFLLNYAKPFTKHAKQMLLMKVLDVKKSGKEPVKTENYKLKSVDTQLFIENLFYPDINNNLNKNLF